MKCLRIKDKKTPSHDHRKVTPKTLPLLSFHIFNFRVSRGLPDVAKFH